MIATQSEPRTCAAGCGAPLDGPRRKWCSEACRLRAFRAQNPGYVDRNNSLTKARAAGQRQMQSIELAYPTCAECGALFVTRARGATTRSVCSERCRNRRGKRQVDPEKFAAQRRRYRRRVRARPRSGLSARQRNPELYRAHDQLRRARRKGSRVGAAIRPRHVHRRDGWRCGLCGEPVLRSLRWPHPRSASIDHVVPLARGGEHSLTNVQTAHLECNVRKGARTEA